jgi:hypothetical protein
MQHTWNKYGIAPLLALASLAACGDATSARTSANQLGFTTGASLGANADVALSGGGHSLDLTAVTLTVSRAEVKPAASAVCADDDGSGDDDRSPSGSGSNASNNSTGHDDCDEMKIGPTTIDLPLDGSVVTVPADAIPSGTFQQLELRLAFIRLQGTFDGKSFDVTVASPVRGEIQFATPLVVTAGTATSITVTVPIGTWLTNADGSLVDPSQLNSNGTLLNQFIGRVAASFHAFEDDDHDGHDDHGGHSGPG